MLDPASRIVDEDNNNSDVRAALEKRAELEIAVIAIKHLRKGSAGELEDDVRDASEWVDVPRSVLMMRRLGDNEFVLGKVKNSEGDLLGVVRYSSRDVPVSMPVVEPFEAMVSLDAVMAEHQRQMSPREQQFEQDMALVEHHVGDADEVSSTRKREINGALGWGRDHNRINRAMHRLGFLAVRANNLDGKQGQGTWRRG